MMPFAFPTSAIQRICKVPCEINASVRQEVHIKDICTLGAKRTNFNLEANSRDARR